MKYSKRLARASTPRALRRLNQINADKQRKRERRQKVMNLNFQYELPLTPTKK